MSDKRIAHGAPIDGCLWVMREWLLGRQMQIAARLDAAVIQLPEEGVTGMVRERHAALPELARRWSLPTRGTSQLIGQVPGAGGSPEVVGAAV